MTDYRADMRRPLAIIAPLLLAFAPSVAGSEQVAQAPMPTTTDTPQYCEQLAEMLNQHLRRLAQPPVVVVELSVEGRRMCGIGLIRGGIIRLRRAMVLLEQPGSAPCGISTTFSDCPTERR